MDIRKATLDDLCEILVIYESAVRFMRSTGNRDQWTGGYPGKAVVTDDIENGYLHVCEENGKILAVFYFRMGDDPTYSVITDGEWLNCEPYGVIHRIAVSDSVRGRGVAKFCFDYAYEYCGNVKIDTHRDNVPMQHSLLKNGFTRCGIIFLENGDERIAFQKS